MSELIKCPFCGGEAAPISNYRMSGVCVGCEHSIENPHPAIQCLCCGGVMMGTSEQWNRRYVCPDKNGKAVFAGNDVRLQLRGEEFIVCRVVEQKQPFHGYGLVSDNDYWTDTFHSSAIELIESEVEE